MALTVTLTSRPSCPRMFDSTQGAARRRRAGRYYIYLGIDDASLPLPPSHQHPPHSQPSGGTFRLAALAEEGSRGCGGTRAAAAALLLLLRGRVILRLPLRVEREEMPQPPFDLPVTDWPTTSSARQWLATEFVPWVALPLICAVGMPLGLAVAACCCARKRRPPLSRQTGFVCAALALLLSSLLIASVLYNILLLLGTATQLEAAALNVTQEASRLTCAPEGSTAGADAQGRAPSCAGEPPSPPPPSARFWPPPPPPRCDPSSLIGFTDGLADGTTAAATAAVAFISNLSAAAAALAPVVAASSVSLALVDGLSRNLTDFNRTLGDLVVALAAAQEEAAPYYPPARAGRR